MSIPRHIAVVMDGNGRWAKARHLPRIAGHKAGMKAARSIVEACVKKKIEVLTLFVFSSENWRRPEDEVSYLMHLFITVLQRDAKKLHEQNVQFRIIGDRTRFDPKLQKQIAKVETLTAQNTGLKLLLAANYGGRWDITQAMLHIAQAIERKQLSADQITPDVISERLSFADCPDPDLFIRTSGEIRISNFMLWQLAYAELYFTPILWPDFDEAAFEEAIQFFANRERRFGYTSEQLKA